jgi:hypothetical protein
MDFAKQDPASVIASVRISFIRLTTGKSRSYIAPQIRREMDLSKNRQR